MASLLSGCLGVLSFSVAVVSRLTRAGLAQTMSRLAGLEVLR